MFIKQLSVFVENKHGRLAEITSAIAKAGVDIRALCIADTTDFGILRMVVDKPDVAEEALKAQGLTVKLTDVIAVGIPDKPGGFASAMTALSEKGISIEYMYAFISRNTEKAYLIMRVKDYATAIEALNAKGIEILNENCLYGL